MSNLHVTWHGLGRVAQCPPNPAYPVGIDVDGAAGVQPACQVDLPYPAPCVGRHLVVCRVCMVAAVITAAGRPDDPRTVRVACKGRGPS